MADTKDKLPFTITCPRCPNVHYVAQVFPNLRLTAQGVRLQPQRLECSCGTWLEFDFAFNASPEQVAALKAIYGEQIDGDAR